jgi:hypothetical protein
MYTKIGECPRCGAPIWTHSVSHSILPSTLIYTCMCFANDRAYTVGVDSNGR